MSLTIATCKHSITDIEGEQVCKACGRVIGYNEVAGITEKDSHNIGMFGFSEFYGMAAKIAKNLNLPQFAIHTIIKTAAKLSKKNMPKKHAMLFATVYACRIHDIPRLLEDIFSQVENTSGRRIRRSEKSILRLLNRISKNVNSEEFVIFPPSKHYYLQAYLAKIQHTIIRETGTEYFETLRARSYKLLHNIKADPSSSAKKAILSSTTSILRTKIMEEMA